MYRKNHSYVFIMNNSIITSPYRCLFSSFFIFFIYFQIVLTVNVHEGMTCWIKQIFSQMIMIKHLVIQHAKFEIGILNILLMFEMTTETHNCHSCFSAWSSVLRSPRASQWVSQFDNRLGSGADEMPYTFQNDLRTINLYLAAFWNFARSGSNRLVKKEPGWYRAYKSCLHQTHAGTYR